MEKATHKKLTKLLVNTFGGKGLSGVVSSVGSLMSIALFVSFIKLDYLFTEIQVIYGMLFSLILLFLSQIYWKVSEWTLKDKKEKYWYLWKFYCAFFTVLFYSNALLLLVIS